MIQEIKIVLRIWRLCRLVRDNRDATAVYNYVDRLPACYSSLGFDVLRCCLPTYHSFTSWKYGKRKR